MATMNVKRYMRKTSPFQWFLVVAVTVNIFLYIYLTAKDGTGKGGQRDQSTYIVDPGKKGQLTVVFREYEDFDNALGEVIKNTRSLVPEANYVVIADDYPYPPLSLPNNAKLVVLKHRPDKSPALSRPELYIDTEYVMIMPDGCEPISRESVQYMIQYLNEQPVEVKVVAWSATPNRDSRCLGLDPDLKSWTLHYYRPSKYCDALTGNFVLLLRRKHLFALSEPFKRPMKEAFFIQTALRGWKIAFTKELTFRLTKKLFQDPHLNWKHNQKELKRQDTLHEEYGIKLIRHEGGQEEWHGCSKRTSRCFGTVLNSMPEYLYHGRWTPPCCLEALRKTARHVFSVLDASGVPYWLEGGSLLGAARHKDIIPWDYDVDIGIYLDDVKKCLPLVKCDFAQYEDEDGFIWERAKEQEGAEFYRVQYSQTNHMHVDIFPFYSKNGTMTKDTWFKTHPQDREFPEHYLKPLTKVTFIGMKVSAPNNYKEFLELKFGQGVIENPKYPDARSANP